MQIFYRLQNTLTSVPSTFTVATSAFDVPMTKSRITNVRAFIVESRGYLPPETPLHYAYIHTHTPHCTRIHASFNQES